MTEEIRLHHDLFNNSGYDPSALPRKDGDDKPIKVLLGMTLNQLVDIVSIVNRYSYIHAYVLLTKYRPIFDVVTAQQQSVGV